MSAPRFDYSIETFYLEKWLKIVSCKTLQYCNGYIDARKDDSPRLAMRIMRSDGKVMEESEAREDVGIGMIAGWPTPEQYEAAAARAMAKAEAIRSRIREKEERDERRRQGSNG